MKARPSPRKARWLIPALLALVVLISACENGDLSDAFALDIALDDLEYALNSENFLSPSLHEEELERITYDHPSGYWYELLFRDTVAYHIRGYTLHLNDDGTAGEATIDVGRTPRSSSDNSPTWLVATVRVQLVDGTWRVSLSDLVAGLRVRETPSLLRDVGTPQNRTQR